MPRSIYFGGTAQVRTIRVSIRIVRTTARSSAVFTQLTLRHRLVKLRGRRAPVTVIVQSGVDQHRHDRRHGHGDERVHAKPAAGCDCFEHFGRPLPQTSRVPAIHLLLNYAFHAYRPQTFQSSLGKVFVMRRRRSSPKRNRDRGDQPPSFHVSGCGSKRIGPRMPLGSGRLGS